MVWDDSNRTTNVCFELLCCPSKIVIKVNYTILYWWSSDWKKYVHAVKNLNQFHWRFTKVYWCPHLFWSRAKLLKSSCLLFGNFRDIFGNLRVMIAILRWLWQSSVIVNDFRVICTQLIILPAINQSNWSIFWSHKCQKQNKKEKKKQGSTERGEELPSVS